MASVDAAVLPTDVVARLFDSLRLGPPGGRWQFEVPGTRFGFEFFIDFEQMRSTSLQAIRRYPASLAGQRVEDVSSKIQHCLLNHLDATKLLDAVLDARGAYKNRLSLREVSHPAQLVHFATFLHDELSRMPPASLYLRPLWGWRPPAPIISDEFVWVAGDYDLNELARGIGDDRPNYVAKLFPPLQRWDGRKSELGSADSWIGASARSEVAGESALQRVRGALSLAIETSRSRVFSEAEVQRGQIALHADGRWTLTWPGPFVPPLLDRPTITPEMLAMMRSALVHHTGDQRLQVALEYAAAGWEPRGRLGFLHNAIAIDALFGVRGSVGKSIREGIERTASEISDAGGRGELLYKIRNALIHGEAASIEACSQYVEYIERFGVDPARDQVAILRACVWRISAIPTAGAISRR